MLVVLDVLTLIVTVVIAIHQGQATQEAVDKGCQNAGALIRTDQRQLALTTPHAIRAFSPEITDDQITAIIKRQTVNLTDEINGLSQGCTQDQLQLDG